MKDYRDVAGRIFNIQKFSVHDGPGIRTIVFLKGCPLRCRWCCNPEGQKYQIQELKMDDGTVKVMGRDVTAGEMIDEVMKDYIYFRRSGGGITLSGGEMSMQPEFAEALLRLSKEYGISTAVESCGYASFDVIMKLLPHIDTFLMDIKHMNSEKHKEYTGRPNELILENAKKIASSANQLIIRVPVIPTFNDTVSEITEIAKFAASLPNVSEMHILPYHRMGSDKYRWLGREYTLGDIVTPGDEQMELLRKSAEDCGINCRIGG